MSERSIPEFDVWYEQNKSYYRVKHEGDEEAMLKDAKASYQQIKAFNSAPQRSEPKRTNRKKKPNPYGFDR